MVPEHFSLFLFSRKAEEKACRSALQHVIVNREVRLVKFRKAKVQQTTKMRSRKLKCEFCQSGNVVFASVFLLSM